MSGYYQALGPVSSLVYHLKSKASWNVFLRTLLGLSYILYVLALDTKPIVVSKSYRGPFFYKPSGHTGPVLNPTIHL